jgi:hypothetical protein
MATLTHTTNSAVGQQYCRDIFLYRTVALHLAEKSGGQFVFYFGCPERVVSILRCVLKFILNVIGK